MDQFFRPDELTPAKREAMERALRMIEAVTIIVNVLSEQMALTRSLTRALQMRARWIEATKP